MGIGLAAAGIGAGLSLYGGFKSAKGMEKTGKAAEKRLREQGLEQQVYNEVAATQAIAVAQRGAFEEERQARLMASRAIAVAAAGGSVLDISNLIADIEGEGAYRASLAMFEGEREAERLRFEGAQAAKYGAQYGAELKESYYDQAKATRLSALGSAFSFLPLPSSAGRPTSTPYSPSWRFPGRNP